MSDSDLLYAIKKASDEVNKASKPVFLMAGKVETVGPLSVRIDQKLVLPEKALILTDAVRDHDIDMTIQGVSIDGEASISGKTTVTIHNALQIGESVLLIRKQGGQQFLIIGRGALD